MQEVSTKQRLRLCYQLKKVTARSGTFEFAGALGGREKETKKECQKYRSFDKKHAPPPISRVKLRLMHDLDDLSGGWGEVARLRVGKKSKDSHL